MDARWAPGVVRRLFDKELDNNHEEPILAAQLAAQQLRALARRLTGGPLAALRDAMLPWVTATLQVWLSAGKSDINNRLDQACEL